MLVSLDNSTPTICLVSHSQSHFPSSTHHSISSSNPPFVLRFRTSFREKLTYLKHLGIIDSNPRNPNNVPSHQTLDQILTIINYLKSKGFSDNDIPELSFTCPKLFNSNLLSIHDISQVFDFLVCDVGASSNDSCEFVLRCPELLFSNVEYCLKPSLIFLRSIGVEKLNVPNNLNAHLLNARVGKMEEKIKFLTSVGFTYEEGVKVCGRLPAIFGYSIENNMEPKVNYLVEEMKRDVVQEVKGFPQYFGFSLRRKIVPRHLHLKQRNVDISLKRMLLCGDEKFYAKWR